MPLTSRTAIAASLALGVAVITYVFFSQYVQGYQPCELCLRERWPWYVLIAVGLIGLARPSPWVLAVIGLLLLVSAGLGLHHVGVEQRWWQGPEACTGSFSADSVEQLRAMLQSAQMIRCDEISWTLFGLSMTTYNFLVSLVAAILVLLAARRLIGAKHA